jgi:hypothetical protein
MVKGSPSRRFVRVAGWLGVIGVAGFCLGVVAAGLAFPGYSHLDQMISELGGAEATRPWIQNVNFVLFGCCVIALAVGLMVDAGKVFTGAVLLRFLACRASWPRASPTAMPGARARPPRPPSTTTSEGWGSLPG